MYMVSLSEDRSQLTEAAIDSCANPLDIEIFVPTTRFVAFSSGGLPRRAGLDLARRRG
jgi:hypothetical protein